MRELDDDDGGPFFLGGGGLLLSLLLVHQQHAYDDPFSFVKCSAAHPNDAAAAAKITNE